MSDIVRHKYTDEEKLIKLLDEIEKCEHANGDDLRTEPALPIHSVSSRTCDKVEITVCTGCKHDGKTWIEEPCVSCGHIMKGRVIRYEK